MVELVRTDAGNKDFQSLVVFLDQDLSVRDGEDHSFYSQFNKIDKLQHVVVAYEGDIPVGCGAIKEYSERTAEIKRMFVPLEFRGRGIAGKVLSELEVWARELNYQSCILETGKKQPEAIWLYQKANYMIIPNYGQYKDVPNSVCMEKQLLGTGENVMI